jgi:hypothetical protein
LFKLHKIRTISEILAEVVEDDDRLILITIPVISGARPRIDHLIPRKFREEGLMEHRDQKLNSGSLPGSGRAE